MQLLMHITMWRMLRTEKKTWSIGTTWWWHQHGIHRVTSNKQSYKLHRTSRYNLMELSPFGRSAKKRSRSSRVVALLLLRDRENLHGRHGLSYDRTLKEFTRAYSLTGAVPPHNNWTGHPQKRQCVLVFFLLLRGCNWRSRERDVLTSKCVTFGNLLPPSSWVPFGLC